MAAIRQSDKTIRGWKPLVFQSLEILDERPPFGPVLIESLGLRGLNCGCGKTMYPGWLNVDYRAIIDESETETERGRLARLDGSLYYLDHDVADPFPLEDGCFEWAYSEHLIEHLHFRQGVHLLKEMRRMLKPGGLARISTPSLARYMEGYMDPKSEFFDEHRRRLAGLPMFAESGVPDRPGWMVNQVFNWWGHRWIYDFGELRAAAEKAGFDPDSVREASFRKGALPEVSALDREGRDDVSLYVEITR